MSLTRRRFALGGAAVAASSASIGATPRPTYAGCGLDRLAREPGVAGEGQTFALLTHAGAIDRRGRRSADVVKAALGERLVALLSPEHGLAGRAAAGEAVGDGHDPATGLPVYSLYGARREPPDDVMAQIDSLIVDLQDVGLRPFTYAPTMVAAMRAAERHRVRVVVLDRPNPLGGVKIDGPRPEPDYVNPVAALPLPFRHGLTLAEIAWLAQDRLGIHISLATIQCQGLSRSAGSELFRGVAFAAPSPNLPSPAAVLAYAASVLVEGTNMSEGRGTQRPFETIGAPWCDGAALARRLSALRLPGVRFTPTRFTPTASKHQGMACGGLHLEVRDERSYNPMLTGLALIAAARQLHPADFAFLPGKRPFFDLLLGNSWVREALLADQSPGAIVKRWQGDVIAFAQERKNILLY